MKRKTEGMPRLLTLITILLALAGCSRQRSADDFPVWGIDVSKHQKTIDWDRVYDKNPPDFVFLKATEGLIITDPTYKKHSRKLESMGVLWGAYHFFGHRTDGREQARHFIRTASLKAGNMLPVLDIEQHRFMTDPKRSVKQAKAFCDEIRSHYGVNPIIYCSTNFYEAHLREAFPTGKYPLWIADYRGEPDHLDWIVWQHTDSHRLRGISGNVDRNVFDGKPEMLKKLML